MTDYPMPSDVVLKLIKQGIVIPASPLALDENRQFDEKYQNALYRYYGAAGAGGIAVGVHSTQFEIRDPEIALFEPLLKFATEAIDEISRIEKRPLVKVAGICGPTKQACDEARIASSLSYDLGLLSLAAMRDASEEELISHCEAVAREIPLIGFYLQPAVGGRQLSHDFWREFVRIPNVIAIKIAPFNRYQTLDVVRALALEGRDEEITLYTGNDDNIVIDLLTPFPVRNGVSMKTVRIRGGLLGQWCVWTHSAVQLLNQVHEIIAQGKPIPAEMLKLNAALTDANAAVFDAANNFAGCIPGIHEVLRRQGLLRSIHCLDPDHGLSPGQAEELDRISRDYPELSDDDFVRKHLKDWL